MLTVLGKCSYEGQKGLLDAQHEKTGTDVFIADFMVLQDQETGRIRNFCVWSKGVDTLLPKTEEVYFFLPKSEKDGDVIAGAAWEQVAKVVGDLMAPQGIYPERYCVTEFPTEEQLVELMRKP